jgi:hypothetical protein
MKSRGKNLDTAYQQAIDYTHGLKQHQLPKYILVSDFENFRLYDLEEDKHIEFKLKDLVNNFNHFGSILDYQKKVYTTQDPANIIAAELMGGPTVMGKRNSVTYGEGMKGMGVDIFIDLRGKSYTITSEVAVDAKGNGVIVCQGGRFGGLSFYMKEGKPAFSYNYLGMECIEIIATEALKPGNYKLVYEFKSDGGLGKGGLGTITVNTKKVAEGRIVKTQPGIFSVDDLADVGVDDGTQVADYGASSKFNGKIEYVTVERK